MHTHMIGRQEVMACKLPWYLGAHAIAPWMEMVTPHNVQGQEPSNGSKSQLKRIFEI